MSIESREAAAALDDIEQIARRVRQSTTYRLSSLLIIMWGVLVFAGNLSTWLSPRNAGYAWIAVESGLAPFTPRQMGTFWPIYFMLVYTIVGLWVGPAFVAIGLGITALTLIGYFFIGEAFPLWMAFVNGGGLILGGLWMRRN